MLKIVVAKDGRPSMLGTYSKMESDSELYIRRRFITKKGNKKDFYRVYSDHNINRLDKMDTTNIDFTNSKIIRWGNTMSLDITGSIVYNRADKITIASDKKLSRELFYANGVSIPKLIINPLEDFKLPLIGRPRRHAKGKNFLVFNTREDFIIHWGENNQDWYYSEFVDKVAEYRLHCAHGKILNYLEKPNPGNGTIAWNRAINGEAFTNVKWDSYNGDVAYECLKAMSVIGLDFGGCDVIVDSNGKPYILEINTSPTLNSSEYSMTRYAKYFDWLNKSDKRRQHFELKRFEKVSNYAWHNYHFEDRQPNKI